MRSTVPALVFALTLACGDDSSPDGSSGSSSESSSSSGAAASTEPAQPGGVGAPCSKNDECKESLWCPSSLCNNQWSDGFCTGLFCESDADCATIDGKAQECRVAAHSLDLSCVWPCQTDSDCPISVGVKLTCQEYECRRECPSGG